MKSKVDDIPCLSFLKGTNYAMYIGPDLTKSELAQLKSQNASYSVIYLPEILKQLTEPVLRYNFPGVDMTESLSTESIYSQIRAEFEGRLPANHKLIARYEDDKLQICDAIERICNKTDEVLFRISDETFQQPMACKKSARSLSSIPFPTKRAVKVKAQDELQDELQEVEAKIKTLLLKGCPPKLLLSMINKSVKLSRLKVTKQLRIYLTDYDNMEIKMGPLPKTVFLFYLRHQEGVMFTHLQDYRDELMAIYGQVSRNDDPLKMKESIDRLVDPLDNSINEKCSSVRKAFVMNIEDSIAENYYISGPQGDKKRIHLDRTLVEWECEL